ncbi:MAG: phosphoribosyltransferase [Actinobacteria bacterium]|nr:phosphoribosyltransferase [Actinomycetota bacterium]MCB9413036.1 phosphoribosyltransferase [Actinomycetota bacterium]
MFEDREDAGRQLGEVLGGRRAEHPVLLALPRGGVPVAIEVAKAMQLPPGDLDVLVVRKIGAPWNPEFGVGAVGEDDVAVIDTQLVSELGIDAATLERIRARESAEVRRRVVRYRAGRSAASVAGREVIVVDDGIATGSTLRAAIALLRERHARRIIVAAPVASSSAVRALRAEADEVVVLEIPPDFRAVGMHYGRFGQVPDADVVAALDRFHSDSGAGIDHEVRVRLDAETVLPGRLSVPARPRGVVVFAHGSGSSRHSSRNLAVAATLNASGCATLLFDLLTESEAADRTNVFDIDLLADRLLDVTEWLRSPDAPPGVTTLPVGYFGASTGAAAALTAAARSPRVISAVVSRGGRPDLAAGWLPQVAAPTLLIVGSLDRAVLALNQAAQRRLTCENRLEVVPGASHLFAEPGTLEQVGALASEWFSRHFPPLAA